MPKNGSKPRIAIITQGADATIVCVGDEVTEYPVTPINKDEIVDANGAGDAFVGGFLAKFNEGKDIAECVKGRFRRLVFTLRLASTHHFLALPSGRGLQLDSTPLESSCVCLAPSSRPPSPSAKLLFQRDNPTLFTMQMKRKVWKKHMYTIESHSTSTRKRWMSRSSLPWHVETPSAFAAGTDRTGEASSLWGRPREGMR